MNTKKLGTQGIKRKAKDDSTDHDRLAPPLRNAASRNAVDKEDDDDAEFVAACKHATESRDSSSSSSSSAKKERDAKKSHGWTRRDEQVKKAKALEQRFVDEANDIKFKDRADALSALFVAESSLYSTPVKVVLADKTWCMRAKWLLKQPLTAAFEQAHVKAIEACHAAHVSLGQHYVVGGPESLIPVVLEIKKARDRILFPHPSLRYVPFKKVTGMAFRFTALMPQLWFSQMPMADLPDSDIVCMARTWVAADRWMTASVVDAFVSTTIYPACLRDTLRSSGMPLPTCVRTTTHVRYQCRPTEATERSTVVHRFASDAFLKVRGNNLQVHRVQPEQSQFVLDGLPIHRNIHTCDSTDLCKAKMFTAPTIGIDRRSLRRTTLCTPWEWQYIDRSRKLERDLAGVVWSFGIDVPRAVADHLAIRARTHRWIYAVSGLLLPLATLVLDFTWQMLDRVQLEMASSHGLSDTEPSVQFNAL